MFDVFLSVSPPLRLCRHQSGSSVCRTPIESHPSRGLKTENCELKTFLSYLSATILNVIFYFKLQISANTRNPFLQPPRPQPQPKICGFQSDRPKPSRREIFPVVPPLPARPQLRTTACPPARQRRGVRCGAPLSHTRKCPPKPFPPFRTPHSALTIPAINCAYFPILIATPCTSTKPSGTNTCAPSRLNRLIPISLFPVAILFPRPRHPACSRPNRPNAGTGGFHPRPKLPAQPVRAKRASPSSAEMPPLPINSILVLEIWSFSGSWILIFGSSLFPTRSDPLIQHPCSFSIFIRPASHGG